MLLTTRTIKVDLFYFRTVFPNGLPQQFSFVSTFRTRKLAKNAWSLFQLADSLNRPQLTVTLNPKRETIEFSLANYEHKLETVAFPQPKVSLKGFKTIRRRV